MDNSKFLHPIPLTHLKNENDLQLHRSVRTVLAGDDKAHEDGDGYFDHATMGVTTEYRSYDDKIKILEAALEPISTSIYTQRLATLDHKRDYVTHGFRRTVVAGLHHFDLAICEAARCMLIPIDHYFNLANLDYNSQSAASDNLTTECEQHYAAEIELLGVRPWINQIKAANKEFIELFGTRIDEAAAKPAFNVKDVRKDADHGLRVVIYIIEAKIAVTGNIAPFRGFIGKVNEIFDYYTKQYATHVGRLAAKKAKGEGDTGEGDNSDGGAAES
jgi:AcrR family transcriptional regulator